jgi:hypothetical protein
MRRAAVPQPTQPRTIFIPNRRKKNRKKNKRRRSCKIDARRSTTQNEENDGSPAAANGFFGGRRFPPWRSGANQRQVRGALLEKGREEATKGDEEIRESAKEGGAQNVEDGEKEYKISVSSLFVRTPLVPRFRPRNDFS